MSINYPTTAVHDLPILETDTYFEEWGNIVREGGFANLEERLTILATSGEVPGLPVYPNALVLEVDTGTFRVASGDGTSYIDAEIAAATATTAETASNANALGGNAPSHYATAADLTSHAGDTTNPHSVTAGQVGAPSDAQFSAHTGDTTNPHAVTAAQVDAPTTAQFNSHVTDTTNPHDVQSVTYAATAGDADTLDGLDSSDLRGAKRTASFTSAATTHDLNTTDWTAVPWDVQLDVDAGFTHDAGVSPTEITFDEAGTYRIHASVAYDSSVVRSNVGVSVAINGTRRERTGLGGYLRANSGHNEASSDVTEEVTVSAGDTLTVVTSAFAASGTATPRANESFLLVEKVSESVPYAGDADTLDGYDALDFVRRNETLANGQTLLEIEASNNDADLWHVGNAGQYGFRHRYIGSGTGTSNLLQLLTDNTTDTANPNTAYEVDQTGKIDFPNTATEQGRRVASYEGTIGSSGQVLRSNGSTAEWSDDPQVAKHHIDDFGGDPTGVTASDAALDAMVAQADAGDYLLLTNGTYWFENRHWFSEPYIIDGAGGEIRSTYGTTTTYFTDNFVDDEVSFQFRGEMTEGAYIIADANRGQNAIDVADTTTFSRGDEILVRNTGYLSRAYQPTRDRVMNVEAITGGYRITLENGLRFPAVGDGASVAVYKINPCPVGGEFRNLNFTQPGVWPDDITDANVPNVALGCRLSRETRFVNCRVDGYSHHAFCPRDGYKAVFEDCTASRPASVESSRGEAFEIVGGSDITLVRPRVNITRRGIDLRSGCDNLTVIGPEVAGAVLHGLSWHNQTTDHVYGSRTIIGGTIRGADTNPPLTISGNYGNALNSSGNARHDRLVGVTLEGRDHAAQIGGSNMTFENCTFRGVSAATPRLLDITDSGGSTATNVTFSDCNFSDEGILTNELIRITSGSVPHQEIKFDDCHFEADSGSLTRIFDLDDVRDLRVTGTVNAVTTDTFTLNPGADVERVTIDLNGDIDTSYFLRLHGGHNFQIRGNISGSVSAAFIQLAFSPTSVDIDTNVDQTGSGRFVRIYEAENVSVSGTFDGANDAVTLTRGPIRDVVVNGLTVKSGAGEHVLTDQSAGSTETWEDIKVKNCYGQGSVDTSGGSAINGLWIKDNTFGSAVTTKAGDTVISNTDNRVM